MELPEDDLEDEDFTIDLEELLHFSEALPGADAGAPPERRLTRASWRPAPLPPAKRKHGASKPYRPRASRQPRPLSSTLVQQARWVPFPSHPCHECSHSSRPSLQSMACAFSREYDLAKLKHGVSKPCCPRALRHAGPLSSTCVQQARWVPSGLILATSIATFITAELADHAYVHVSDIMEPAPATPFPPDPPSLWRLPLAKRKHGASKPYRPKAPGPLSSSLVQQAQWVA